MGRELVEIDSPAATLMERTFVVKAPVASESRMVKLGALAVGVPEMMPVPLARFRPVGNAPADTVQLSGAVPPDEASVVEYAAPIVAFGKEFVVMVGAAATTMESTLIVDAPAPSESCTVKLGAPDVGVPEMRPVAPARLSPAGSEPAVTVQPSGAVPPDSARGAE